MKTSSTAGDEDLAQFEDRLPVLLLSSDNPPSSTTPTKEPDEREEAESTDAAFPSPRCCCSSVDRVWLLLKLNFLLREFFNAAKKGEGIMFRYVNITRGAWGPAQQRSQGLASSKERGEATHFKYGHAICCITCMKKLSNCVIWTFLAPTAHKVS